MAEYIERESAMWAACRALCYPGARCPDYGCTEVREVFDAIPAADVAPVAEINDAVDEAIRILNAIWSSGRITYNTYCELHDAICDIYQDSGADMREVQDG